MFYKIAMLLLVIMYVLHKRERYGKGLETSKARVKYTAYTVSEALSFLRKINYYHYFPERHLIGFVLDDKTL